MDTQILLFIHQKLSYTWLDYFFYWISTKSSFSIPLIFLICVALIARLKRRGGIIAIALVFTIICADALGHFLKSTIQQPRPCLALSAELHSVLETSIICSTSDDGMPSNHALNFFAAFTFLALALRNKSVAYAGLSLALLVGFSRIYLGVHYPSQVLVGATIGILFGWFMAWISRKKTATVDSSNRA